MNNTSDTDASSATSRVRRGHPLELIPFFRRWQPSLLRDLVYTMIWGLGFCLFFFALYASETPRHRMGAQLWNTFVISMSIAFTIHGLYALAGSLLCARLQAGPGWWRTVYNLVVPVVGVFAGFMIGIALINPRATLYNILTPGLSLSIVVISVVVACVLLFAYRMRERELQDRERLAQEQQRLQEAERRALAAQLRMLQAQIEPHFLYNTLANAVGLIGPSPERARLLLEHLIEYLRATLAASRHSDAPLQGEINTITAYLELMKLRMGERLRYRIDLSTEAAQVPMPPMLLQPLVENAISHGLEPKIDGGEIAVAAHIEAGRLCIAVSDTGVGFQRSTSSKVGGGVGLSNLRERMAVLYGDAGSMDIIDNAAGGVSVTLRIPLSTSNPGGPETRATET
ncbi:MAG: sensor histidine kinase [Duganella sp.]